MSLSPDQYRILERFARVSSAHLGAWFLDLDGVALIQDDNGSIFVSPEVEQGIRGVHGIGQKIVINSLRFPVSIIQSIGPAWLKFYGADIPAVLLNGALIGNFKQSKRDGITFEESAAFPLTSQEIDQVIDGVEEVLSTSTSAAGRDLGLFFYPRDWHLGEIVWIPEQSHMESARERYKNASEIVTWKINELRELMKKSEPCMAVTLIHGGIPQKDRSPWNFFSRKGVNKSFGGKALAHMLGLSLVDSVGAGDSLMDTFLGDVGLAIHVGKEELPYKGGRQTLRVMQPSELGQAMTALAGMSDIHRH